LIKAPEHLAWLCSIHGANVPCCVPHLLEPIPSNSIIHLDQMSCSDGVIRCHTAHSAYVPRKFTRPATKFNRNPFCSDFHTN